uniref:Uncharacterized protein n=1 Tax=Rhizophora mucronata TaxID=61149 RepID=A0A2P2Q1H0_RHIMU
MVQCNLQELNTKHIRFAIISWTPLIYVH